MPTKPTTESSSAPETSGMAQGREDQLRDLAALQALGFGNMTSLGVAWIEALGEMGSEVVSFVADRIKEEVKTQHEILHCKDPKELQEIQARFVQKAVDQYSAETGKLVEMSQDLLKGVSEKLQ